MGTQNVKIEAEIGRKLRKCHKTGKDEDNFGERKILDSRLNSHI